MMITGGKKTCYDRNLSVHKSQKSEVGTFSFFPFLVRTYLMTLMSY